MKKTEHNRAGLLNTQEENETARLQKAEYYEPYANTYGIAHEPYRPDEQWDVPEEATPEVVWTKRRVVYLLIALILIAALIVYLVLPMVDLMLNPPPPPPLRPPIQL